MKHYWEKYSTVWICIALTLVTTAVFYEVCTYDFVNYDDPRDVYDNPDIKNGLNLESIKWAFTTSHADIWHPLTWLTHILAWQIFGSNAGGHHLFNLILHIANTLLVFIVFKKMTGAVWQSAFVSALFAIHPLHVQSVAWVTERKDVLSTFFMMLTIWAYWGYVNKQNFRRYVLIIIFFALGLMSKAMLVTLPFVLLLLDYWPLERLWAPKQKKQSRSLKYLILEKIPLMAMSACISIITFLFQDAGGVRVSGENFTLAIRTANAFTSYMTYMIKMFWPSNLAFFYRHPGKNISILYAAISIIVLAAITAAVLLSAKKKRYLLTGWFWYLGTLIPVVGFVQVGIQARADRYTYIPLNGLFVIIAWAIPQALEKLRYRKIILITVSAVTLSSLSISAYFQQKHWKNMETLCVQALRATKNNSMAHYYYMKILLDYGKADEAQMHLKECLRLDFNSSYAPYYLGRIQLLKGNTKQAVANFETSLKSHPQWVEPMNDLAWFLSVSPDANILNPQRAISLASKASELTNNDKPEILDTLAAAHAAAGDFTKAADIAKRAIYLCEFLKQEKLKQEIIKRLHLYKQNIPYIETEQP